jgi:hypothetical protein
MSHVTTPVAMFHSDNDKLAPVNVRRFIVVPWVALQFRKDLMILLLTLRAVRVETALADSRVYVSTMTLMVVPWCLELGTTNIGV